MKVTERMLLANLFLRKSLRFVVILSAVAIVSVAGVGYWRAFSKVHFEGLRKVIVSPTNLDLLLLGERETTILNFPPASAGTAPGRLSITRSANSWEIFHQDRELKFPKTLLAFDRTLKDFYGPNGEQLPLHVVSKISAQQLYHERWQGLDLPEWWDEAFIDRPEVQKMIWDYSANTDDARRGQRSQGGILAYSPETKQAQYIWWSSPGSVRISEIDASTIDSDNAPTIKAWNSSDQQSEN